MSDERPMKIGESSMIRVSSMASASCAGSPNRARYGMKIGAASQRSAEAPTSSRSIALMTLEATRQPSCSRSFAR